MAKITYTSLASQELNGDDKREARMHLHRDGSLQGWCVTSSKKSVLWRVNGNETVVGLANEASLL